MFVRESAKYLSESNERVNFLVNENVAGNTKKDILPNKVQPLQGEVEAMYFKAMRVFLESGIVKDIVCREDKPYEG